jgi:hypothetical protein
MMGLGPVGPKLDGLAELDQCLVELAGVRQGAAKIIVRLGVTGSERDRLLVSRDGLLDLIVGLQGATEVRVSLGIERAQCNGLAARGDRVTEPSGLL